MAHPPTHNGMEVDGEADAPGSDEDTAMRQAQAVPVPQANGYAAAGVKRSGDDLAGSDEKRRQTHSQSPFQAQQVQQAPPPLTASPAPVPAPAPAAAPAPVPAPQAYAPPPAPYYPAGTPTSFVPAVYNPPPHRDPGPITPLTQTQHKYLLSTVRTLKKNKDSVNFLEPVDIVRFGIPHYVNIVKNPMDLGTVETKLIVSNPRGPPKDKSKMGNWDVSKGRYGSVSEVTRDVRQIWENTRMFNGPDHLVSQSATRLEQIYEKALATLPVEVS